MSSLVVVIESWIYCLPHNEESLVSMLFGTFIHTLFNFKIVFIFVFVSIFNERNSKDPGNYSGITSLSVAGKAFRKAAQHISSGM